MIKPDGEQGILAYYKSELEAAEARLDGVQREVDSLHGVVDALEARMTATSTEAFTPTPKPRGVDANQYETLSPRRAKWTAKPDRSGQAPHNGKPTIISLIRVAMADGMPRDVDQVMTLLARENNGLNASQELRKSVSNRMWDLKKEGYLERVDRGVYRLARQALTTTATPGPVSADSQDFAQANGHGPAQNSTPDFSTGGRDYMG